MAAPLATMKIGYGKKGGSECALHLPSALGRALHTAGYTHADVHVTSAGVLLVPKVQEVMPRVVDVVELPDWS